VAMRRAWSSFFYHGKVQEYYEKSNVEAIHAELFEKIRKPRRPSKVPPVHRPIHNADAASGVLAEQENRTVQAIQSGVSEPRINRELRFRFEQEYEAKFNQWQKENGHELQG
jgi:hypothetical protein